MLENILQDIHFDTEYGDIDISNEDFVLVSSYKKFILNYINDKLKSGYMDYFRHPEYGTDLQSYIGTGISESVLDNIRIKVRLSLAEEGYLKSNTVEVYTAALENSVYLRVVVELEDETISTGLDINYKGGITIAT
jgi:phage baseplate assembly protein W